MKQFAIVSIAMLSMLLSSIAFAKDRFTSLPDLTEENLGYQLQRCSAFYAAFNGVLSEALLETSDPLELARLQNLAKRTMDNSDGLLKSAFIVLTTLEGLSDSEAVNLATDSRNGYTMSYLRLFFSSNSTVSRPLLDGLWKNDAASCSAIASNIVHLMEALEGK